VRFAAKVSDKLSFEAEQGALPFSRLERSCILRWWLHNR